MRQNKKMHLKSIIALVTLIIILQTEVNALLERDIIVDYFKMKSVAKIIIFSCENQTETIDLTKFLMSNSFYVSILNHDIDLLNVSKVLFTVHDHFGVALDADCDGSSTILNWCANNDKFFEKFQWLIFSTNTTVILKVMSSINLFVNAEITLASPDVDKESWQLLDVYNPGYNRGGTLKVHDMGTWSVNEHFNICRNMSVNKYWRRKDMSEVTMKATIVLMNPFPGELLDYLHNDDTHKYVDTFNRFQFLLWNNVKEFYNFTMLINLRHVWGKQLKNGSHIGMTGALQRKEIDFGIPPVFFKYERIGVLDYLTQTFTLSPCFIFRNPKPVFSIRGAFFSPLSSITWLATWGIMLLTMITIRICFHQECNIEVEDHDNSAMEYDLSYILLLAFGGLCQQDVPRIPNLYSGRMVIFTSVLFTYILYQFYSGGIVSSLLSDPPITINDLKDLMHSSLEIGMQDEIYERDFFDQTTDPLALELHRTRVVGTKNGSDAYYKIEHGMRLVKDGDFAFHVDPDIGYKIIAETYSNEIICDLNQVHLYPTQPMAGVSQKRSPFKELYLHAFARLTEHGLMYREKLRWTTPRPECIKVMDSSKISVGMNEFFPALLFYMVGAAISLLMLLFEIILKRYEPRRSSMFMKMKNLIN